MLKIIGAILLCGGASVLGLSASARLGTRARVLASFSKLLDVMHSEIGEMLTPLDELMQRLADMAPAPLDAFFRECLHGMAKISDTPFAIIWAKAVARATYLELKPVERQTISELGTVLGRYGADEQARAIAHTARAVEALARVAEEECGRVGRLYGRLGIICGIAVAIVFI